MSSAARTVGKAAAKRLSGSRPGPVASFVAAVTVGAASAVATYRLLRSGS